MILKLVVHFVDGLCFVVVSVVYQGKLSSNYLILN